MRWPDVINSLPRRSKKYAARPCQTSDCHAFVVGVQHLLRMRMRVQSRTLPIHRFAHACLLTLWIKGISIPAPQRSPAHAAVLTARPVRFAGVGYMDLRGRPIHPDPPLAARSPSRFSATGVGPTKTQICVMLVSSRPAQQTQRPIIHSFLLFYFLFGVALILTRI